MLLLQILSLRVIIGVGQGTRYAMETVQEKSFLSWEARGLEEKR